ncbi:MAG TPA: YggS family pyridoxal phosphate-dependent enzyme [Treponemataceae bacterium]|jgi:hypothetical protein|nr:YggS family pyridoxal phosphate-dependent enzyme [Treponemataceae bacterium]
MSSTLKIHEALITIQEKMDRAIERSGRRADTVKLMAVSKFHTIEEILAAADEGLMLFGENRVQEACEKFPSIMHKHPQIQLHMIGSLQRNKVKSIVPLASCIQSVDRLELIEEIQKQAHKNDKIIDILLEYHTGEESKSGFTNENELYKALDLLSETTHLKPRGFMTMAPFTKDEQAIRASFRKLRMMQEKAQKLFSHFTLNELSMGMSNDYEIAIEEGSTLIRVGTALFGSRE